MNMLGIEVPAGNDPASVYRRIQMIEQLTERSMTIPGIGYPVGMDAVIGLIPVLGDIFGVAMGAYIVWEARNLKMRKRHMLRMAGNIAFDGAIGLVPVVGDAFDFGEAGEAVKELVVVLEDHEEEHEEMQAEDFNRKMLDICLLLNPVLYTENGPFGRDAGGNRGVLPGPRRALGMNRLDPESGEWKVLRAFLTRERNRLCATISRAILVGRG